MADYPPLPPAAASPAVFGLAVSPLPMPRFVELALVIAVCGGGVSCRGLHTGAPVPAGNPLFVAASNHEVVWERTVDVLHEYHFHVARENKLDGVIETDYLVGSGVLEPWHHDSIGVENRLESTLQSIRRRAVVTVTPSGGGYWISVEALKEIEDLPGLAANTAGGATFQESTPLDRDLNLVVGQTAPSGWILLGRDVALEQDILARLQKAMSR